jgi:hypothetical protein
MRYSESSLHIGERIALIGRVEEYLEDGAVKKMLAAVITLNINFIQISRYLMNNNQTD